MKLAEIFTANLCVTTPVLLGKNDSAMMNRRLGRPEFKWKKCYLENTQQSFSNTQRKLHVYFCFLLGRRPQNA